MHQLVARRVWVLLILCLSTIGCQTITVVNSSHKASGDGLSHEKWNHTGIFGLVGYSGEFYVQDLCAGDWSSITTERGLFPSLIEGGFFIISEIFPPAYNAAALASFIWDPLTLRWVCSASSKAAAVL